jgi:hypothetical protein
MRRPLVAVVFNEIVGNKLKGKGMVPEVRGIAGTSADDDPPGRAATAGVPIRPSRWLVVRRRPQL